MVAVLVLYKVAIHSHNIRRAAKNHLQVSSANNIFRLKTFSCRAPKLWIDLPSELLEIESVLKFITSVNDLFQKILTARM